MKRHVYNFFLTLLCIATTTSYAEGLSTIKTTIVTFENENQFTDQNIRNDLGIDDKDVYRLPKGITKEQTTENLLLVTGVKREGLPTFSFAELVPKQNDAESEDYATVEATGAIFANVYSNSFMGPSPSKPAKSSLINSAEALSSALIGFLIKKTDVVGQVTSLKSTTVKSSELSDDENEALWESLKSYFEDEESDFGYTQLDTCTERDGSKCKYEGLAWRAHKFENADVEFSLGEYSLRVCEGGFPTASCITKKDLLVMLRLRFAFGSTGWEGVAVGGRRIEEPYYFNFSNRYEYDMLPKEIKAAGYTVDNISPSPNNGFCSPLQNQNKCANKAVH